MPFFFFFFVGHPYIHGDRFTCDLLKSIGDSPLLERFELDPGRNYSCTLQTPAVHLPGLEENYFLETP